MSDLIATGLDQGVHRGLNESQKEYVDRLVTLLTAERLKPRSDDPFGPVDYFASILYAHHKIQEGVKPHDIGPWWKLSEVTKSEWREKSKATIASWAMDQLMAAKAANS